ncbi:hypothetical protein PPACK8108_LOCUS6103 [Phakopsora pachyrhizi]|uniref:Uncharacterized protein n=1 Tax=Phakopsora pachyrhizi TaxID=170000 RepID=A0AAV0ATL3_PHAPC|nr:hypothetical protein PPACK8108_LOCUS6103 [Phakopsora pachyrhizi]
MRNVIERIVTFFLVLLKVTFRIESGQLRSYLILIGFFFKKKPPFFVLLVLSKPFSDGFFFCWILSIGGGSTGVVLFNFLILIFFLKLMSSWVADIC